jgi:galactose mutarotase-like enzyme
LDENRNTRLILLERGGQRARVYPEQGFALHGFEQEMGERGLARVVYGPEGGAEPPDRRFGNPVLFPSPSTSHGPQGLNSWEWENRALPMAFHGFARDLYWKVLDLGTDHVTGELTPQGSVRVAFPFDFALRLTYRLDERGLVLDAQLTNTGAEAFPYALGFHPYLRAPLGAKGSAADASVALPGGVQTRSDDGWRSLVDEPFAARRLEATSDLAGSLILTQTQARALELEDHANGLVARVSVEGSETEFPVWVVWSASPDSPYVCLEPWTDVPNALNRPQTRRCPPGQTHRYQMVLSVRAM